jgi:HK97 family phage prohead protease
MTTTETEAALEAMREADALEVPVDLVAVRTYAAELTPGDGRTVDIRIVPYGVRASANDGLGGVPYGVQYTEEFVAGVFDHEISAPNRVLLDFEHSGKARDAARRATANLEDVVGRGLSLTSKSDGFHGAFRMLETAAADTALALVKEGVLTGASVECRFLRSIRGADGVVRRVKAKLERVALCRESAYLGAGVLGVRTAAAPVVIDEELLPIPFDQELASRISALGITIPDRLLEPPATDPSAPADPSESTPSNGADND